MKNRYWSLYKKVISLVLVVCTSTSLVACDGRGKEKEIDLVETFGSDVDKQGSQEDDLMHDILESTDSEALQYTYHDYLAGSPDVWNPHEFQIDNEYYILQYTAMGLYSFQFNETRDGYEIEPEMAAAKAVDVTEEYAGNQIYGVPEDATSQYAFRIALNENACWEDGTPINADTYIYSMQQLLDPEMKNYRASTYTTGAVEIANAYAYNHSGLLTYSSISSDDGQEVAEEEMYLSMTEPVSFFQNNSAKVYYDAGYSAYFKDDKGNDLYQKYAGKDYITLTEEAKQDLMTISANFGNTEANVYREWCFVCDGVSEKIDFDQVGLIKTGDYEITIILANPITEFNFYNGFSGSTWIVYKDYYEAGKMQTGDMIKTNYGTSVDTYMSYGPYKLTEFQSDKQITLVKNENWYGYTDGLHDGQFQTTAIGCQIIEAQATALQLFLQGELDTVSLVSDDMSTYRVSDYIIYTPQPATSKLTFNGDYTALKQRESEGVNKTLLSYHDFRKALALSIDRNEFATQCTATQKAGFGILNDLYVSNPETGELYRNTEQAKRALCDFYQVSSEDQITGYDKEEAKRLINSSYEAAFTNGDIDEDDIVDLEYLVYKNDDSYVKTVKFIQEAFSAAAVGTPLEGRIHITMTADEDYYNHAKQGAFEMITSTWGGSPMDPYRIMECYALPDKLYEYGFNPKKVELTIELNGEALTKSFYDWYDALVNKEYAVADTNIRNTILAAMEKCILEQAYCTPVFYYNTASLNSKRCVLGSNIYVQLLGYGGIRYLTYTYDDVEWAKYCDENNNQLTY